MASNYREHRENRMVGILRRTAIFDELVERFVAGQSVICVADWVYKSKPKGLEAVSYGTLRVYLTALRARIRHYVVEQIQGNHEPSPPPEPLQAERIAEAIQMTPMPPHRLDRFESMIDKKLRDLSTTDMLRGWFVIQEERIHEMRQLEARTPGMLLPNGYKEIELGVRIAVAIARIDMAAEMFRAKGMFASTMPPTGSLAPGPDDLAVFSSFAREGRSGRATDD
jgi:hypothetical protein